jgi:ATP-independent RNA helicase DbpA
LDLGSRGHLDVSGLSTLVLDEADKMLEMGFAKELEAIISELPARRQTVLFSATFPEGVRVLSEKYQKSPLHIQVEAGVQEKANIEALAFEAEHADKLSLLMRILQQYESHSTLIFCNQKSAVGEIFEQLNAMGASVGCLHGDLEQRDRNRVLMMFRNGSLRILVATDVAARGLDIENLELVINYDLPQQTETYIHRIGRTGRAGRAGRAVCLAGAWDQLRLHEMEKASGIVFQRPSLGFKNQNALNRSSLHCQPDMQTLWISGGRKDKLRPGDIVGAFTGDGGLSSQQLGKIDVQDEFSYVAVSNFLKPGELQKLRSVKIKGKKFQIQTVNPKTLIARPKLS